MFDDEGNNTSLPPNPKGNDLPKYYLGKSIELDIQLFGG
jgi:hypothetical protein